MTRQHQHIELLFLLWATELGCVQGGNILHGAVVGLISAGNGELMAAYGGSLKAGGQLAVQCVVGGTISELGGGNFANGAITVAFSFMFNHVAHQKQPPRKRLPLKKPNEPMEDYLNRLKGLPSTIVHCNEFTKFVLEQYGLIDSSITPLAKDWATPGDNIEGWQDIELNELHTGCVAAYEHNDGRYTGHCGIILEENGLPYLIYMTPNKTTVQKSNLFHVEKIDMWHVKEYRGNRNY